MIKRGLLQAHRSPVSFLARIIDLAAIGLSGWIADLLVAGQWFMSSSSMLVVIIGLLLSTLVFSSMALYDTWRGYPLSSEIIAVLKAWAMMFFLLAAVALVTKTGDNFSRLWLGCWFLGGGASLVALRLCLRYLLHTFRARGFNTRTVVVIGDGDLAARLIDRVRAADWTGFRILGCFAEHRAPAGAEVAGVPVLGSLDQLATYVDGYSVDQVWIALPWDRQDLTQPVFETLRYSTADLRMVPDIFSYRLLNHAMSEVAGMPIINLSSTPMDGVARLAKKIEDQILASTVLVLLLPVLLLLSIGVKMTSRGPILFKQVRNGWAGGEVEIWKFRTMVVHQEDHHMLEQACYNDRRVTRFGRVLRRSSLDELPQFINVVQGRMSIVGPRPHALSHTDYYKKTVQNYMLRHKVKPGITGWAQINGLRGRTDTVEKMSKRIEHDLYYIENWSVWLDLKIIASTVGAVFSGRNAD